MITYCYHLVESSLHLFWRHIWHTSKKDIPLKGTAEAKPRNIQFRQGGPRTFLFLLLLWFLLPSPVDQIFIDFPSIFYIFSDEKTSTKSFGLDSQGRGLRTEFTKTWRWNIRHLHQTHHVTPKGKDNSPEKKTQIFSEINVCRRSHRSTSPLMRLQLEAKFRVPSDSLQCLVAQQRSWEISSSGLGLEFLPWS